MHDYRQSWITSFTLNPMLPIHYTVLLVAFRISSQTNMLNFTLILNMIANINAVTFFVMTVNKIGEIKQPQW